MNFFAALHRNQDANEGRNVFSIWSRTFSIWSPWWQQFNDGLNVSHRILLISFKMPLHIHQFSITFQLLKRGQTIKIKNFEVERNYSYSKNNFVTKPSIELVPLIWNAIERNLIWICKPIQILSPWWQISNDSIEFQSAKFFYLEMPL